MAAETGATHPLVLTQSLSFSGDLDDESHKSCDNYIPNPIVDYSMLISNDPSTRSQAITHLHQACLNLGFFTVTNHGIPDSLMGSVVNWLAEFFDQTEEEKQRYETNDSTDRIRFKRGATHQREFLHIRTHPTFHCPTKPANSMYTTATTLQRSNARPNYHACSGELDDDLSINVPTKVQFSYFRLLLLTYLGCH